MSENAEMIEYWNGQAGDIWVENQRLMDGLLAPFSGSLMAKAAVQPGERVLDVGCGCGTTSFEMRQLGATVRGVDVSQQMISRANEDARGMGNITFSRADAATQSYTPDHQLVFSRFGVMFFADPTAAFQNLHSALAADGRLVFACWQAPAENPWISIGARAVQPFLEAPETPPDPKAPGPFAFADPDYVEQILSRAGYRQVRVEGYKDALFLGGTMDEVMHLQTRIGPLSRVLGELPEERRNDALRAAEAAFATHITDQGIRLGGAIWLVSAVG